MTDILHQDSDVCILNPNSDRGVLISTYQEKHINIKETGIYSLRKAKELGLTNASRDYLIDNIFFRPRPCEYSNFDTRNCYEIRVDPEKTYVYDQETHAKKGYQKVEYHMLLQIYLDLMNSFTKDNNYEQIMKHRLFEVRVHRDNIPYTFFVKPSSILTIPSSIPTNPSIPIYTQPIHMTQHNDDFVDQIDDDFGDMGLDGGNKRRVLQLRINLFNTMNF